jgi:hypothetical protein
VGQIVGKKGHGIPVETTFTLTDVTSATVIDSETGATGHGSGHPNQTATHCSGVIFEVVASDFFGPEFPPGVAPTDTIEATIDGFVTIKQ